MQSKSMDLYDAQAHLPELMPLVNSGTEIILTQGDSQLARIVAIKNSETAHAPRRAGLHPGSFVATDDFDEPLPDEFWLGSK